MKNLITLLILMLSTVSTYSQAKLVVDGNKDWFNVKLTQADFGPRMTKDVKGVLADGYSKNSSSDRKGCSSVSSAVRNKIALIDRGDCYYTQKVSNAEISGAIAVVICNYDNEPPVALPRAQDDNTVINIPSYMMHGTYCQQLRVLANQKTTNVTIGNDLVKFSYMSGNNKKTIDCTSAQFGIEEFGKVNGSLVRGLDANDNNSINDGCQAIKTNVNNKIALIDRGTCNFSQKVLNAQNKGAIAVVICNSSDTHIQQMTIGNYGKEVNIPSVIISKSRCTTLKSVIDGGRELSVMISSDDNQVIDDFYASNGASGNDNTNPSPNPTPNPSPTPNPQDCKPVSEVLSASTISEYSAFLSTDQPYGVQLNQFRYRPRGNSNWKETFSDNLNYKLIENLDPGTEYEFEVKHKCDTWLSYGSRSTFRTLDIPSNDDLPASAVYMQALLDSEPEHFNEISINEQAFSTAIAATNPPTDYDLVGRLPAASEDFTAIQWNPTYLGKFYPGESLTITVTGRVDLNPVEITEDKGFVFTKTTKRIESHYFDASEKLPLLQWRDNMEAITVPSTAVTIPAISLDNDFTKAFHIDGFIPKIGCTKSENRICQPSSGYYTIYVSVDNNQRLLGLNDYLKKAGELTVTKVLKVLDRRMISKNKNQLANILYEGVDENDSTEKEDKLEIYEFIRREFGGSSEMLLDMSKKYLANQDFTHAKEILLTELKKLLAINNASDQYKIDLAEWYDALGVAYYQSAEGIMDLDTLGIAAFYYSNVVDNYEKAGKWKEAAHGLIKQVSLMQKNRSPSSLGDAINSLEAFTRKLEPGVIKSGRKINGRYISENITLVDGHDGDDDGIENGVYTIDRSEVYILDDVTITLHPSVNYLNIGKGSPGSSLVIGNNVTIKNTLVPQTKPKNAGAPGKGPDLGFSSLRSQGWPGGRGLPPVGNASNGCNILFNIDSFSKLGENFRVDISGGNGGEGGDGGVGGTPKQKQPCCGCGRKAGLSGTNGGLGHPGGAGGDGGRLVIAYNQGLDKKDVETKLNFISNGGRAGNGGMGGKGGIGNKSITAKCLIGRSKPVDKGNDGDDYSKKRAGSGRPGNPGKFSINKRPSENNGNNGIDEKTFDQKIITGEEEIYFSKNNGLLKANKLVLNDNSTLTLLMDSYDEKGVIEFDIRETEIGNNCTINAKGGDGQPIMVILSFDYVEQASPCQDASMVFPGWPGSRGNDGQHLKLNLGKINKIGRLHIITDGGDGFDGMNGWPGANGGDCNSDCGRAGIGGIGGPGGDGGDGGNGGSVKVDFYTTTRDESYVKSRITHSSKGGTGALPGPPGVNGKDGEPCPGQNPNPNPGGGQGGEPSPFIIADETNRPGVKGNKGLDGEPIKLN